MIITARISKTRELPIGLILSLVVIMIFMTRFVKVTLSGNIMGNHAYVQMVNSAVPILKGSYYNEEAYEESTITIGSLIMETLYLDKINPKTILSNQVAGFAGFTSNNELVKNESISVKSFELSEESVAKVDKVEKSVSPNNVVRNEGIIKTLDQSKPEVLLYNSHTTEAFTGEKEGVNSYNNDMENNIVGVTSLIEKELEEYYGIAVIHDKTVYCNDFNKSYEKSRAGVQKYLDKYGDFKVIVDVHRDAGIPTKDRTTATVNGENVAKLLFPTGKNNKNYTETQALIERMNNDIKSFFPELYRGKLERNRATSNSYNQDLSKNAVLIEVGADRNTEEEAKNTAKYVARLIAEEVHRKSS
ncbi:MAG: stage II sporulation protein P [Sarcina sp.]